MAVQSSVRDVHCEDQDADTNRQKSRNLVYLKQGPLSAWKQIGLGIRPWTLPVIGNAGRDRCGKCWQRREFQQISKFSYIASLDFTIRPASRNEALSNSRRLITRRYTHGFAFCIVFEGAYYGNLSEYTYTRPLGVPKMASSMTWDIHHRWIGEWSSLFLSTPRQATSIWPSNHIHGRQTWKNYLGAVDNSILLIMSQSNLPVCEHMVVLPRHGRYFVSMNRSPIKS